MLYVFVKIHYSHANILLGSEFLTMSLKSKMK